MSLHHDPYRVRYFAVTMYLIHCNEFSIPPVNTSCCQAATCGLKLHVTMYVHKNTKIHTGIGLMIGNYAPPFLQYIKRVMHFLATIFMISLHCFWREIAAEWPGCALNSDCCIILEKGDFVLVHQCRGGGSWHFISLQVGFARYYLYGDVAVPSSGSSSILARAAAVGGAVSSQSAAQLGARRLSEEGLRLRPSGPGPTVSWVRKR